MKKTLYHTQEEIEKCKFKPTKEQEKIGKLWKSFHEYGKFLTDKKEREIAIKRLCFELLKTVGYHYIDVQFVEGIKSSCFLAGQNKIWLKDRSIITALHETAHAMYGPSELKACSWSIKLFKTMFPEEYEKLHWEGHMLKK